MNSSTGVCVRAFQKRIQDRKIGILASGKGGVARSAAAKIVASGRVPAKEGVGVPCERIRGNALPIVYVLVFFLGGNRFYGVGGFRLFIRMGTSPLRDAPPTGKVRLPLPRACGRPPSHLQGGSHLSSH